MKTLNLAYTVAAATLLLGCIETQEHGGRDDAGLDSAPPDLDSAPPDTGLAPDATSPDVRPSDAVTAICDAVARAEACGGAPGPDCTAYAECSLRLIHEDAAVTIANCEAETDCGGRSDDECYLPENLGIEPTPMAREFRSRCLTRAASCGFNAEGCEVLYLVDSLQSQFLSCVDDCMISDCASGILDDAFTASCGDL